MYAALSLLRVFSETAVAIPTNRMKGNDLITPRPMWNFPGLKDGDRWCICATRWMQAHEAGAAPKVVLEATHEKLLEYIELDKLVAYASK